MGLPGETCSSPRRLSCGEIPTPNEQTSGVQRSPPAARPPCEKKAPYAIWTCLHTTCTCRVNPSIYTGRQTDDGFRACAGPGGPGLRMVCGGDLRWRHHLRRWCKATSSWHALGSTTSSPPHLLKWAHLRSIPADLKRCRRMPSHAFFLLP